MTLAAIAPFADGDTVIRNVGHIRGQECDRMAAIINELTNAVLPVIYQETIFYIIRISPRRRNRDL